MAVKCSEGPFVFRLNENGTGPLLLIQVCTERGWREYVGDNDIFKDRWNLWWRSGGFALSQYKPLLPWQFVNRIPKGSSICRKDNLVRHLKCMRRVYGSVCDFSPVGYNLPSEYTKLAEDCSRYEKDERVWICKPVGQSQGKGIFLFRKLSDLSYDSAAVVQQYIENPLLIGGYKFDLRLYVCVPSYCPLTIYLYKEGLVRFATEKFSLEHLNDSFRHLTNFSLNKLGPGYSEKKERIGAGCKWTFRQLRRFFEQFGHEDWLLWQRITCLITSTILSQAAGVPRSSNCFEFFGFDVLIDENLKPWLLEVNLSPALSNDCEIDSEVKKPLLHDLFDLLGLPVRNTGLSFFTIWSSENIDEDVVSNKFYSSGSKKNPKIFSPETHSTLRQSTPDVYTDSWSRYTPLLVERSVRRNLTTTHMATKSVWDNGKDWRVPCVKEGGWIRTYPFMRIKNSGNKENIKRSFSEISRIADRDIKNTVSSIQRYLKAAKEIQSKYGKLGDNECNAYLTTVLNLNTEVWLPDK